MTWRWKNIHFGPGDDSGPPPEDTERRASSEADITSEKEKQKKLLAEILGQEERSTAAAEQRLKMATETGTLLERANATVDLYNAKQSESVALAKDQYQNMLLEAAAMGETTEAAEKWLAEELKLLEIKKEHHQEQVALGSAVESFASNILQVSNNSQNFAVAGSIGSGKAFVTVPAFGFGIRPLDPNCFPSLPSFLIISGEVMIISKSNHPF